MPEEMHHWQQSASRLLHIHALVKHMNRPDAPSGTTNGPTGSSWTRAREKLRDLANAIIICSF